MFGSEQRHAQSNRLARVLYRLIGEFRFPLRLRGFYLSKALSGMSPGDIWDAGCGTGQTSFHLARRFPGARLLGTDLNSQRIAHCQEIAQRSCIRNVDFTVANLLEAQFEKRFDLIVTFEVFEYIDDFHAAFRKLGAALRPNGVLVFHARAAGRFQRPDFGLRRFFPQQGTPESPAIGEQNRHAGFEKAELIQVCAEAGLEVECVDHTFGALAMHAHTVYELIRARQFLIPLAFPVLFLLGWIDWHLPRASGGGLLVRARRQADAS